MSLTLAWGAGGIGGLLEAVARLPSPPALTHVRAGQSCGFGLLPGAAVRGRREYFYGEK